MSKPLKVNSILAALVFALMGNNAYANDFSAKVEIGHDSNPFRLSSDLDPEGSEFVSTEIKGEYDLNDSVYLLGRLKDRRYGSNASDADNYKAHMGLGFKEKVNWFDAKSKITSELSVGLKDKTYVSRLSGEIGESGGEPLEDRYDYQFWDWNTDLSVSWNKKNKSTFYLNIEQRDYEDFDIDGLSNFDYTEYVVGADWKHKLSKRASTNVGIEKSYRDFDDRRERDLSGNSVDGTDLSYDGWQLSLKYSYKFNKQWRMSLLGQYDYRQDSGSGYYGWERLLARTSLAYKADKYATLKASVSFNDDSYDKRAKSASLDDEELSAEQGIRYKLSYERKIPSIEGLSVVASVRYDDIDADIESYKYDRSQVAFGMKYRY